MVKLPTRKVRVNLAEQDKEKLNACSFSTDGKLSEDDFLLALVDALAKAKSSAPLLRDLHKFHFGTGSCECSGRLVTGNGPQGACGIRARMDIRKFIKEFTLSEGVGKIEFGKAGYYAAARQLDTFCAKVVITDSDDEDEDE
ncbi:hypothetical protein CYMTET_51303 [Cymbomonas tetramitiformis]|uniref:Uncharacterized protein n=1 Tax=Cymbomonas tetramitiformis TaxID=36881 RepID=A0AAE0BNC1_9CHLO|nr:hypothetical protein CYMTET_51303 [Cymbomonas tetramitiformis]